MHVFIVD